MLSFFENTEVSAGTKKIARISDTITPMAVKMPKSLIIVRYAPRTNDTNPMAVVTAARTTGIIT